MLNSVQNEKLTGFRDVENSKIANLNMEIRNHEFKYILNCRAGNIQLVYSYLLMRYRCYLSSFHI